MPSFLHVGCGRTPKSRTTPILAGPEWHEVRLDIDPNAQPDIVASMTDMAAVPSQSMDGLYAHHTLEHLFPHDVPVALAEFARVLHPDGFAIIGCPDLQQIGALLVEGKLLETVYVSPAGPISALDMVYGLGAALREGRHYMAHRGGFTQASLRQQLGRAGFATVVTRQHHYNITAYALRQPMPDDAAIAWARTHFV